MRQDRQHAIAIVVGGQWHSRQLADGIRATGARCTVFDTEYLTKHSRTLGSAMRLLLRISGRYRRLQPITNSAFTRLVRRHVRDMNPDLILAWSSFALELFDKTSAPVAVVRGSSHIRTQSAVLEKLGPEVPRPSARTVRREEREYLLAEFVTVPTEFIARDPNWHRAKLVIAPYAIESRAVQESSPPGELLDLIFVGELGRRKGVDRLALLDQVHAVRMVHVVGSTAPGFQDPLPNKALVHGYLPSTAVADLLLKSHALVLLSREEGMARVGLEAIAVGLPLLVTEESGLGDWCRRGAGIVLSSDPSRDEIEYACDRLRDDWAKYSAGALALRSTSTWETHARTLLKASGLA